MTHRMLIDATHPEETRVVVLDGHRLEEFDFESASKKQLKGNIYLAKVTRVEPSLQAAFVEYGGNRHGFLAFGEIHPDYYQIPVADRQALAAEQAALDREAREAEEPADDEAQPAVTKGDAAPEGEGAAPAEAAGPETPAEGANGNGEEEAGRSVEAVGGAEIDEVMPRRPRVSVRNYRIQEVIKKRQILLVQVVKEERGTKGAALTTFLSIAGRYCVLMPNSARGGGISRKITDAAARKKLRSIATDLEVPEGMGVIIRTAGLERTKAEIKRDFDYLLRQWEEIREGTLKATAPALIYGEADLIRRALRDLYANHVEEVLVEGEEGYKSAKAFMKMMMPSHAKRVKPYKERIPLFQRYQVESQLDAMHSPTVQLKSGGYIVMNPTEALVAIDVNSGRSTRERNIEETAYKTNLEAADEVARQLRLRDLAGLIVIDFIDMDDRRNDRNVERRLKEALKNDRARIQLGRISPFGLLELSRQRLRPSLIEASTVVCPHCGGLGHVRSTESTALHVLRALEEEGLKERSDELTVHVPTAIALYLLNHKRAAINALEERYGLRIIVERDDALVPPNLRLDRTKPRQAGAPAPAHVPVKAGAPAEEAGAATDEDAGEEQAAREESEEREAPAAAAGEDGGRRRRRRRRRRRDGEGDRQPGQRMGADRPREQVAGEAGGSDEPRDEDEAEGEAEEPRAAEGQGRESGRPQPAGEDGEGRRRRRRGRRGGRRRGRGEDRGQAGAAAEGAGERAPRQEGEPAADAGRDAEGFGPADDVPEPVAAPYGEEPAHNGEPSPSAWGTAAPPEQADEPLHEDVRSEPAAAHHDERPAAQSPSAPESVRGQDSDPSPDASPRRGWWQRLID